MKACNHNLTMHDVKIATPCELLFKIIRLTLTTTMQSMHEN